MHAVAAFFASIIAVVSSVFTSPAVAPEAPVDSRAMHAAAAAATQIATTSNPFFDPSAPPVAPADTALAFSPPSPQTVINQPVIERIIERVVQQGNASISADKLTAILTDFGQSIENRLAAIDPPKADIPQQVAAAGSSASYYFAPASQRIDQLSNTAINTPTITGGSISGASISGYLPTSGGSLSGALSAGALALSDTLTGTDATFSGTLTAGTLNVAGVSSGGALVGPYFTATSTTATSSFAGGLTAANGGFSILQNGSVGIGTTSPGALLSANGNILGAGTLALTGTTGTTTIAAGQGFTIGGSQFVVQQGSGNVGIGTANPAGILDVAQAGASASIYMRAASAPSVYSRLYADSSGIMQLDADPTATGASRSIRFRLGSSEKMRIDSTGKVGIGTTSPLTGFHVNNLGNGTVTALSSDIGSGAIFGDATTNAAINLGINGGNAAYIQARTKLASGVTLDLALNPLGSNVGIGTTTPWGKLSITGSGTGTGLAFAVADSANTPRFVIQDRGNVGIGTTTPGARLHVLESSGEGNPAISPGEILRLQRNSASNSTAGMFIIGGTQATNYIFLGSANGYSAGGTLTYSNASDFLTLGTAGAEKLRITSAGNVGIGTTSPVSKLHVDGTIASGGSSNGTLNLYSSTNAFRGALFTDGTDLKLSASGGSTNLLFRTDANDRMVIASTGNVGIGTTTPEEKLHIYGTGSATTLGQLNTNLRLQTDTSSVNAGSEISFRGLSTGAENVSTYAAISAPVSLNSASGASGYLSFSTKSLFSDTSLSERMRITQSGNVGIGTTTPSATLDVNGLARFGAGTARINLGSSMGTGESGLGITYGTYAPNTAAIQAESQGIGFRNLVLNPSGGNVGIGTTSPNVRLQVQEAAGNRHPFSITTSDWALNNSGSELKFRTGADTGNTWSELQATINGGGNVGTLVLNPSGGNVGIGTTTPGALLHAETSSAGDVFKTNRSGTSAYFAIDHASSFTNFDSADDYTFSFGGTERVRFDSTGNIGIGTTTPSEILSLAGATGNAGIDITPAGWITKQRFGAVGGNGGDQYISVNYNPASGGTVDDATIGTAQILLAGRSSNAAFMSFGVGLSNAAPTEWMRITSTGNVGIGTTTPGTVLEVASAGSGGPIRISRQNNSSQAAMLSLVPAGTISVSNPSWTAGLASGAPYYSIATYDGGGTNHRLVVDTNGNVGIGTTTPNTILQVVGAPNGTYPINYGIANISSNASQATGVGGSLSFGGKYADAGDYTQWASIAGLKENSTSGNYAGSLNFYTRPQGATIDGTGPRMTITSTGNVGIGTTTPSDKLTVGGNVGITAASYPTLYFKQTNTDKTWKWSIGGSGSQTDGFYIQENAAGAIRLLVESTTGNVGIGTTTPTAQFSTTGTVRFAGLGSAGANLVTDALGNVTASSDERLKDKQGDFTRGLDAINAISPVLYKWRPETGFDTQSTYAGFFAQNVQAAIPEAVSQDARGHLTLADRPILAALVNAVKELAQRFSDLAERITTKELTFDRARGSEIAVHKLCVDDICITREQFAAMVAAVGQTPGPSPLSIPASASQAPVIELNGNASSTINIGDTYNDLGARIVAPERDLNLGIVILLDGATTTQVSIDTSTPGEHAILYTVTSPTTGLTGSILRTVLVRSAAEQLTLPVVEDDPFTSPPANDNVSTTSLLFAEPVAFSL